MKGLLIKDYIMMKSYGKTLLFIGAVFILLGMLQGFHLLISMLGSLILISALISVVNSIAYDNSTKWDRYAISTPVGRKIIIRSKYCFFVSVLALGCLLLSVLCLILNLFVKDFSLEQQLISIISVFFSSIFMISIIIPLIYRFGVEKARLILMIFVVIPAFLPSVLSGMNIAPDLNLTDTAFLLPLLWIAPILIIAACFFSYFISFKFYQKKEF